MSGPFCPKCGYNLRGAASDAGALAVCPECGTRSDLKPLAARQAEEARKAVSPGVLVLRLLWLPAAAFVAGIPPVVALITLPIAWLFVLIFGIFNARTLARRLAAARAMRHPDRFSPKDAKFIAAAAIALYFTQVALAAGAGVGGCAVCMRLMGGFNVH